MITPKYDFFLMMDDATQKVSEMRNLEIKKRVNLFTETLPLKSQNILKRQKEKRISKVGVVRKGG